VKVWEKFFFFFFYCFWFVCSIVSKDCADTFKAGERDSRVYTINPDGSGIFDVFCDHTTAGGGWLVFQKRLDGSVDFYRGWTEYKRGFGSLTGEFWLGLDKIHLLTSRENYKLRVDLEDFDGNTYYAEYDLFGVASEGEKYKLSVETHSGLISLRSLINFTPSSTTFVSLEKESLQVKILFICH